MAAGATSEKRKPATDPEGGHPVECMLAPYYFNYLTRNRLLLANSFEVTVLGRLVKSEISFYL
jgi:hypothetical protein